MNTRHFSLLIMLGLLVFSGNSVKAAPSSAEDFLKKSVNRVIDIANASPDSAALAESLTPVLLDIINFDAMTRRAVGPGWRQFADNQQSETIKLFTKLVIRTYSSRFTPGEFPVIDYKSTTSPEPGRVEITTTTNYKGSKYDVVYRLEEIEGKGWRVTDVVIEGVSMVANYRSQFDAQFKSGGAEAVIGSLKKSTSQS